LRHQYQTFETRNGENKQLVAPLTGKKSVQQGAKVDRTMQLMYQCDRSFGLTLHAVIGVLRKSTS
jgi:hypothetical protein